MGLPISTCAATSTGSHSVAALAARTNATNAPTTDRRFQPPCHCGRLGRTYPGGVVVPFLMECLLVMECTFHYKRLQNQNPLSRVRSIILERSVLLNSPIHPLSDSPTERFMARIRRTIESSAFPSARMSLSLPAVERSEEHTSEL